MLGGSDREHHFPRVRGSSGSFSDRKIRNAASRTLCIRGRRRCPAIQSSRGGRTATIEPPRGNLRWRPGNSISAQARRYDRVRTKKDRQSAANRFLRFWFPSSGRLREPPSLQRKRSGIIITWKGFKSSEEAIGDFRWAKAYSGCRFPG